MKKQEIRKLYTEKVAELLAQGYTIFPDTMSGSQGEIAHIDLTNGSEILRVLLEKGRRYDRFEDGYYGDTLILTVGKASDDTIIHENWDGTVWNQRLEPRFQIEWAEIADGGRRSSDWYTTREEGARICRLQWARREARNDAQNRRDHRVTLGDAYKSIALRWLRKQPRMKSCRLEDIEKVERVFGYRGHNRFEIKAKGKTYFL